MSTQRARSIVELLSLCGKIPAVAALAAFAVASPASAQPGSPQSPKPAAAQAAKDGDKPKVTVSEHMTVDLHVKDEDLAAVLELLSIQSQKNIIASKNVSARITATLYGVTFYEALDAILHVNGFGYIEQGNFIYVYTTSELEEIQKALSKRVAKVIHLNYLNASDAAEFVKPLLSAQGGEVKTSSKSNDFNIPSNAPTGKDDYALGATLVVIDYEENIAAVEKLLAELDTKPAQVLVEATVLQTSLNEANAFGVDFSIIGDINFTDFINVGGPRRAADALITGGSGSAGSGLSPADNQATAITSTPGNTSGPGTFKVGIIADDISIFMRMLDEVTDSTILSNPKILALNRQPSRVLVGRRVGYLNTTSTETSTTQTVEFLDTGTQLYFRPFVAKDNSIRMELKPQVSEAIIREARDATGAAVSIPDEVTQELVTNVIVRDGQTVVLGGLFRESTTLTRRQVPFLGDIPLIGAAFRGHDDNTARSEIIFLITPSIVNDTMLTQDGQRALDDTERLRAGARQGLLPWSRERMTGVLNVEAEKLARDGQYEKALWNLQRSLSISPSQPDALRLRERITGERELWPGRSLLEDVIGQEAEKALLEIPQAPEGQRPHFTPDRQVDIPRRTMPVPSPAPLSRNSGPEGFNQPALVSMDDEMPVSAQAPLDQPEALTGLGSNRSTEVTPNANPLELTATLTPAEQEFINSGEMPASFSNAQQVNAQVAPQGDQLAESSALLADQGFNASTIGVTPEHVELSAEGLRSRLDTLARQVELYRAVNNGSLPALGTSEHNGWAALIKSGQLTQPPSNPFVTGENSTKVVIGSEPDAGFHANHGWTFDPATGSVWATGLDASNQLLPELSAYAATAPGAATADANQLPRNFPWYRAFGVGGLAGAIKSFFSGPDNSPMPENAFTSVPTEGAGSSKAD